MNHLPKSLITFLKNGQQLRFDESKSDIGPFSLKKYSEITVSKTHAFPGCQNIIDDPYGTLEGQYEIEIIDLVKESEYYDPEGLLCWINSFKKFGCIDEEHGEILVYSCSWDELVNTPLKFIDSIWGQDENAERILPWLHFPFKLFDTNELITPYSSLCNLHNLPISTKKVTTPLYEYFELREDDNWFKNYKKYFPNSGISFNEETILCCSKCQKLELEWNIPDA